MADEQISEFDALPDGTSSGTEIKSAHGFNGRRLIGEVGERIKSNPAQNLTIIGAVVLSVIGMGVGLRVLIPEPIQRKAGPQVTLADALAALDAEDFEGARSIAADLRLVDDLEPQAAVDAARLHFESGVLSAETFLMARGREALEDAAPLADKVDAFESPGLYFGGVHVARRAASADVQGAGDARRNGKVRHS